MINPDDLHVAVVSIHAVVNTDDLSQTVNELLGRVETHETVIGSMAQVTKPKEEITKAVEDGSFTPDMLLDKSMNVSYMNKDGDDVYIQMNF